MTETQLRKALDGVHRFQYHGQIYMASAAKKYHQYEIHDEEGDIAFRVPIKCTLPELINHMVGHAHEDGVSLGRTGQQMDTLKIMGISMDAMEKYNQYKVNKK